jgi:hypothetical protein
MARPVSNDPLGMAIAVGGGYVIACASNLICAGKAFAIWSAIDWLDDIATYASAASGDPYAQQQVMIMQQLDPSGATPFEGPFDFIVSKFRKWHAANNSAMKTIIDAIRKGKTPNDIDSILRRLGINFNFTTTTTTNPQKIGDPAFNLHGYGLPIEIRLHLNSNGSIDKFRFGINLYSATPANPYTANPADLPYLKGIDNVLISAFGKPIKNWPVPPGSPWKGEYIDYYGYIYLDFFGNLGGLRTDDVHFGITP